jgi:signal transduction histidine kinase
VTNAAHAIADTGTIDVSVEPQTHAGVTPVDLPDGQYIRLSIADTGAGIDDATLPRVFDPFFSTKPAGEGTGLGLSIVHEIVRAHGGAVSVRSRLGEGTSFDVYLPLVV